MKDQTLNQWLTDLTTIENLQEHTYPSLSVLKKASWEVSHLGELNGENDITGRYLSLDTDDRAEIENLLRKISVEDLQEIQGASPREIDTRKGLALLLQTQLFVQTLVNDSYRRLRKIQSLRDVAVFEMERRSRQEAASKGMFEALDPFTARFLFGPPAPPMTVDSKTESVQREKKFLLARVKSGKKIAVKHLRFTIPDIYDSWVMEELRKAGLAKEEYHGYHTYNSPPSMAGMGISRLYYQLGFKPLKETSGYYHIYYYNSSWSGGWNLGRSREFLTSEITPVD